MSTSRTQSLQRTIKEVKHVPSLPSADETSLLSAAYQLLLAQSLDQIFQLTCTTARALASADGAALILGEKNHCLYAAEDAIGPLWKGKRFPAARCVSGWTMEHRVPALIPDIYQDPRIPIDLYRSTFVRALAIVPMSFDTPIGAIGIYWAKEHHLDPALLQQLQSLAGFAAASIENMRRRNFLSERLNQAEAELQTMQRKLLAEMHLRDRLESKMSLLDQTDSLTGLNNHLGFLSRATQLLKLIDRVPLRAWLVYVELDDFLSISQSLGRETTDHMIQSAARVLRESLRESDLLARIRDDEFVAFVVSASDPIPEIEARLIRNIDKRNQSQPDTHPIVLSIGAVRCDPRSRIPLDDLIHQADAAMYRARRKKRLKVIQRTAP